MYIGSVFISEAVVIAYVIFVLVLLILLDRRISQLKRNFRHVLNLLPTGITVNRVIMSHPKDGDLHVDPYFNVHRFDKDGNIWIKLQ